MSDELKEFYVNQIKQLLEDEKITLADVKAIYSMILGYIEG